MFPPLRRASVSDSHRARRGAVNRQAVADRIGDEEERALRYHLLAVH